MNIVLRKYFWLVYLLSIFLGTAFLGKAVSHLVESFLFFLPPITAKQEPVQTSLEPQFSMRQTLERNIFCSFCKPPEPENKTELPTPIDESGSPQRSSLSLELTATVIVPGDRSLSFGILKNQNKQFHPFGRGDRIPETDAIVVQVIQDRVYIQRDSKKIEYIDKQIVTLAVKPALPLPTMVGQNSELDQEIDKRLKCNGNTCTTDREFANKLMANTTALSSMGRFSPYLENGKQVGFRVALPRGLLAKLGMKSGDILQNVNGLELSSPDKALEAYAKLKTSSHITLSVKRGSEIISLDTNITP